MLPRATVVERGYRAEGLEMLAMSSAEPSRRRDRAGNADMRAHPYEPRTFRLYRLHHASGWVYGRLKEVDMFTGEPRRLLLLLGIALFAAGPTIVGYQAIGWFMHGYWTGMPFSVFWSWIGGATPKRWLARGPGR
jgi:hypothetical protein